MSKHEKSLPGPKDYPILPPDMDYIYFENAEAFPFEPEKIEFSLHNAWWLSECAFLVYNHPGFARMAFKLAGFEGFRFFQGTGTECMAAWNDDAAVVVFRGTEMKSLSALHEVRTDLNTIPVPFEQGGKVHRGFLLGLGEVWDGEEGLNAFLNQMISESPERPVWMTGHSLGGALASLCFARTPAAAGLYLYGAPRVGDQEFVDLTAARPVFRIEHARDPIPMVPPDMPALKFNFKDLGQLVFINREGEILPERPQLKLEDHRKVIEETLKERKQRREQLSLTVKKNPFSMKTSRTVLVEMNDHFHKSRKEWKDYLAGLNDEIGLKLEDHMPIYYSMKLWNALISGNDTP